MGSPTIRRDLSIEERLQLALPKEIDGQPVKPKAEQFLKAFSRRGLVVVDQQEYEALKARALPAVTLTPTDAVSDKPLVRIES